MCYDLSTSSRRSRRGGMRPPPCRTSGYVQTYRRVVHERDPSGVPRHHSRTHDARCWRPVHAVRGLGSDGRRDVSRSRGVGSKRPARTSPHSGTCAHHVRTVARDDTCDVAGERCPCPEYKCKSYTRGNKVNNFFTAIALALALVNELGQAEAAIKAGQPATIGDPASGGAVKTYLFGKHVAIGPIPINPA